MIKVPSKDSYNYYRRINQQNFLWAQDNPLEEPVYKDSHIKIYKGDCAKVLFQLPVEFAQAVITDPPYPITGNKVMNWDGGRDYVKDIDDNEFADGFDFNLLEVMDAKLVNTNMQFFCNKAQLPDYFKWAENLRVNWQLLSWHKPDCIPIGMYYLLDTEYIVHMYKKMNIQKRTPSNTYFIHNIVRSQYDHPTPKAVKIVMQLIENSTDEGDIIIDPFLGTGTTASCAKMLNRRCIGIELKDKYIDMAIDRCKKTEANQKQVGFLD